MMGFQMGNQVTGASSFHGKNNLHISLLSSIGWPFKLALKPNNAHTTDFNLDLLTNSNPCGAASSPVVTVLLS